jgi:hypothetical protein
LGEGEVNICHNSQQEVQAAETEPSQQKVRESRFKKFLEACNNYSSGITAIAIAALVIATLALAVITFFYLLETQKMRNLAFLQLQISNVPRLDIHLQKGIVTIKNIGEYKLLDFEVIPISHEFEGAFEGSRSPLIITDRIVYPRIDRLESILESGTSVKVLSSDIVLGQVTPHNSKTFIFYSIIILYRREVDQKRFVDIEPFIARRLDNETTVIIPLAYQRGFRTSGPPAHIRVLQEIERIERILFRVRNG